MSISVPSTSSAVSTHPRWPALRYAPCIQADQALGHVGLVLALALRARFDLLGRWCISQRLRRQGYCWRSHGRLLDTALPGLNAAETQN